VSKAQDEKYGMLIKGVEVVEKVLEEQGKQVLKNTIAIRVIYIVASLILTTFGLIKIYDALPEPATPIAVESLVSK